MKLQTNLLTLLLACTLSTASQTIRIKSTPVLDLLFRADSTMQIIQKWPADCYPTPQFPAISNKISFETQFVKSGKDLFAILDGTGVVYKATEALADSITFSRIDSTLYFGNTYGAIKLSFDDTLYSFGGYGFYRNNGHLLFFTPGKDWNIVPLNQEVAASNIFFYYDDKKGIVHFAQYPYTDEATKQTHNEFLFYKLDIRKSNITKLGLLSRKLHFKGDIRFKVNLTFLKGTLLHLRNEIILVRPGENKMYRLLEGTALKKLNQMTLNQCGYIFEYNKKIYYNNYADQKLDSISLALVDFEELPDKLYESPIDKLIVQVAISSIFLALAVIASVLFRKYLKSKKKLNSTNQPSSIASENRKDEYTPLESEIFSFIEQELIFKIHENGLYNKLTTVEEINNYLGLKKKSIEVQKKVRTETINRINIKFKLNSKTELDLIIRHRSEDDKRFYNYTLDTGAYTIFQRILNIH